MGVGVYLCSFVCNKWPRMTFPPLFFGTLIEAVGIGMLAWTLYNEQLPGIFGMMALTGVGIGLRFMVAPLHGIGIFKKHRAALIGLMAIATPFGGTIGLTIMSTVFNNTSGLDYKHSDFSKIQEPADLGAAQAVHDAKVRKVLCSLPCQENNALVLNMAACRWGLCGHTLPLFPLWLWLV